MAKVMISSRVAVHETTSLSGETWARTDLGWINGQYIVMDTETTPAPTTADPTPGALEEILALPEQPERLSHMRQCQRQFIPKDAAGKICDLAGCL